MVRKGNGLMLTGDSGDVECRYAESLRRSGWATRAPACGILPGCNPAPGRPVFCR